MRARNYDHDKAFKMWCDSLAWRQEFAVDGILDSFSFHEREQFLMAYVRGGRRGEAGRRSLPGSWGQDGSPEGGLAAAGACNGSPEGPLAASAWAAAPLWLRCCALLTKQRGGPLAAG
jgi:hypothetical protein